MHSAAAYRALVERLQAQAAAHPGWYRFKLLLLAAFGYGVLVCALLLALGLSVGIGALLLLSKSVWLVKLIKFVWIPLLLAWAILQALWVRVAPPGGRLLGPQEAPALRAEVERLRRAAGAPPLAGIVIDADFNAAAQSVPRMLGLAGSRHFLVLGLPLLRAMTADEAAAVIAHEFGHFNAGHGRFAGRIYRVRASWFRLLESLQQQASSTSAPFLRFFNWYAPYFNAYSFVLARENEYEADAASARVAGAATAGRALVRAELAAHRLQARFWPQVQQLCLLQPQPPTAIHADMARALTGKDDADEPALARAMARSGDLDDTHPTLAQRLAALGVAPAVPEPLASSAAEQWLGEFADRLQADFDARWVEETAAGWQQRHAEHQESLERLLALRARRQDLDDAECLEYALRVEALDTPQADEDVGALLREAVRRNPGNALAHFRLGARRLAEEAAEGIRLVERAIELDPDATEAALMLLAQHHHGRGETTAFDAVLDRLRRWQATQERGQRERQVVRAKDAFEAHGLDAQAVGAFQRLLRANDRVAKAWLVRKRIEGGGSVPHFVLVVQWRGFVMSEDRELQRLVDLIEVPGSLIAIQASSHAAIARKVRKVARHPSYRRGWFGRGDGRAA